MSTYEISINGKTYTIEVGDLSASPIEVIVNGERKTVTFRAIEATPSPAPTPAPVAPKPAPEAQPTPAAAPAPQTVIPTGGKAIKAPMPGKILSIRVKVGDKVNEGDTVCTLEAMKMEMPISATTPGTVQAIPISVGQTVVFDDPLVIIG